MLGREPVRMELERVGAYLAGQVVMVTGAGGSIGAELCRQIARVGPRRLVLRRPRRGQPVRDPARARGGAPRPHGRAGAGRLQGRGADARGVRRAPAQRRLPRRRLQARGDDGAQPRRGGPQQRAGDALVAQDRRRDARSATFVLVSTDKAVKPATVMGASKALAEWAVEAAASASRARRYSTVRFGNVLGSSGSVVPIFRRQIAAGGPVTVTDRRMSRYFMTIPEAVQLIIRAGSLREGSGEVFVLEMGEPVKIIDLAETMIRALRARARARHRDRDRRRAARREVPRGPVQPIRASRSRPPPRRSCAPTASRSTPRGWRRPSREINLLVLEGDAAGLAEHVARARATRRGALGRRTRAPGPRP